MTRELLERCRMALEYHQTQTRPIHNTTLVIEAIRAHLAKPEPERKPIGKVSGSYHPHQGRQTFACDAAIPIGTLLYADPPGAQPERGRCEYCDGTGDVTSIDGDWRGRCNMCDWEQPKRKPMPEHIARHLAIMALPYSVRDYALNLVRSVEAFHGIVPAPEDKP